MDISSAQRVSFMNSSSATLGSSGVFTGTSEDVSEFATISIAVFSNVASATNGLSIQFSVDGTNWDHIDAYTIPAATGKTFTVGRVARYFRVVYTNGGTGQTSFRLQCVLNDDYPKPSSHRIQDSISTQDDAELVKAVLSGEKSTSLGAFENVQTIDGRLLVSTPPGDPITIVLDDTSTARAGKLYFVNTGFNSIATPTETVYFLIKNPSGSGKVVTLEQLILTTDENIGATYRVRLYLDPTITANGTALTPVNARQVGTVAVSSTTYRSPTVSANGTLVFVTNVTIGNNLVDAGSILLDENHNYLVTVQTDNTANFNLLVNFSEQAGI